MSDLQKLQDDLTEVLGTKDTAFVMGIIEGCFNEDRRSPLGLLSTYMKRPARTSSIPPVWYYDGVSPKSMFEKLLAPPPYPHFQAYADSKEHFKLTTYMPDLLEYKPQGQLAVSYHSLAKNVGRVVKYIKNRKDII